MTTIKSSTDLFNEWDNLVSETRNEIVFEDRNKLYGAYALRRNHNKLVAISLLITGTLFILGIGFPKILDYLSNEEEEVEVPVVITNVDLTPPPPLDETEPPPPPPPPPPVLETVKFTPPVVTDEEVEEEEMIIQQEETPNIGVETHEGDGDEIDFIPEATANTFVEPKEEQVFQFVSDMPSFPGGEEERQKFFNKKIVFPQVEREAGISGTCYVEIFVEKDGTISDAVVKKGIPGGPGYDKEAVRVAKLMPKWKPGKQNGNAVKVRMIIPIKFKLE